MAKIKEFFEISNLIENIEDENEVYKSVSAYTMKQSFIDFHKDMGYLNHYCIAGEYRTYPVYVGGREGIKHTKINSRMKKLLSKEPKNWNEIKQWHVNFEHIHPFGDGNGRIGRYLMALQCDKVKCLDKMYNFFITNDFDNMRKIYYKWF